MKRQFREVNIDNFLNENENMNTKKKTESDMKLFNQFLLHKQDSRNVENIPAHELNNLICEFLLGFTKKIEVITSPQHCEASSAQLTAI
ncbi:hypothetical protein DPMN_168753 [Dreissena polymorpha]|uniref:Uncharacterized protein n=1 Tax=Dreissena polymorpha TaxID=45954 RepID=A0A9D4IW76_DREPO|nr:hypothetical protein DPMN_168753 [Dreissena polymorpha]